MLWSEGFSQPLVLNLFEVLLRLKQEGSAMEHQERFEIYSSPLKISYPSYLKGIFVNGLKEEIRAKWRMHPLNMLAELMDLALLIDEKHTALRKELGQSSVSMNSGGNYRGSVGTRREEGSRLIEKKREGDPWYSSEVNFCSLGNSKGTIEETGGRYTWKHMSDAESGKEKLISAA